MLNDPLIIINTAIAGSYFTISGVMFSKLKNNQYYVTKNTLILLIVGLFLASGVGHSFNIIQSLIDENMNTGFWSTLNILADVSVALGGLIYILRGNTKSLFGESESDQKRKLTVENNQLNRFNHLLESKVIECTIEMVKINEKLQEEIEVKERLTAELTTKNMQLQQSLQKLETSEQKYRDVLENIKEVIFQTDAKGNWQFLNPAWTEITGFSLEETLGHNSLKYIHPDDRKLCHLGWE
ncbi:MAG TPA: PAS domain S-box protein, partial [Allocoleopsis sp.]